MYGYISSLHPLELVDEVYTGEELVRALPASYPRASHEWSNLNSGLNRIVQPMYFVTYRVFSVPARNARSLAFFVIEHVR
jgi:hypothetical protein